MYKDLSGGRKESYKQEPSCSNVEYQNYCHFTNGLWGLIALPIMYFNKMIQVSGWNLDKDNEGFMGGEGYPLTVSSHRFCFIQICHCN